MVLAGVAAVVYFGKRSSDGHDKVEESNSYDALQTGRRSFEIPTAKGPTSRPEARDPGRRSYDIPRVPNVSSGLVVKGSAYVSDGDTLTINKTQIRLFGIDAPELNHPYGKNAKWALVSLCKGMTIQAQIIGQDSHGRNVAKCYLQDGTDLSAEMVKLGLAIDWPKFSGGIYGALELPGIRKKLWLADARQKGRMHVWQQFEAKQNSSASQ